MPFLTVLAPTERYYQGHTRAHKTPTDWARQVFLQVRRWIPGRRLIFVADSSFAVIWLLARVQRLKAATVMVTRCRLDARLFEPAPPRKPQQKGRSRKKGAGCTTIIAERRNPLISSRTCTDEGCSHHRGFRQGNSTPVCPMTAFALE